MTTKEWNENFKQLVGLYPDDYDRLVKTLISNVKSKMKSTRHDYLLNWTGPYNHWIDPEYSWVEIVDDDSQINRDIDEWIIYVVDCEHPHSIQIMGRDNYKTLHPRQLIDMMMYFNKILKGND